MVLKLAQDNSDLAYHYNSPNLSPTFTQKLRKGGNWTLTIYQGKP